MVTYREYSDIALVPLDETLFEKLENRVEGLFTALCGRELPVSDFVKKAIIYQVEFIANIGTDNFFSGEKMTHYSYSVGGESESKTFSESSYSYSGLDICPQSLIFLKKAGVYREVEGVRVI